MLNRFFVLIIWLSLFPLIAVTEDKKCSVFPTISAAIAGNKHQVTCLAKPGTMILSWKSGYEPSTVNYTNISSLGVLGTSESLTQMRMKGYMADYYSLRKSTVKIANVTVQLAGYIFCFVLDITLRTIHYCESELNVFVSYPFFGSTGIDLAKGIVTNITCAVSLMGSGILHMTILDGYSALPRNSTKLNFKNFGLHDLQLPYHQEVNLTKDQGYYRVAPELNVQSVFICTTTLEDGDGYQLTAHCVVEAPVTRATIVPHSPSKCSQRSCNMHQRLMCISDGKPKPDIFNWSLALEHETFEPMLEQTHYLETSISGRNTFECRVFNAIDNYNFSAAGRFTTHVEAYEWTLDKYAMYLSKGSKHEVCLSVTIVVAITGIVWVFMPCCRHRYCHV